jgi:RNA polymerase sigma-70 factor (ECF subfamily)
MSGPALGNAVHEIPLTFGVSSVRKPGKAVQDELQRPSVWDEDALVRRAQVGESEAFERIYEIYVRRMYALSLRMVSDHQTAEELTQDIFVRAWEAIGSFRFESALGTWLHRLGTNVVLGHIRSKKRHEYKVTAEVDLENFESGLRQAMPETKMDLEKAIAQLPAGAKEVLILHDIEGYRYREIAELTEVAEGTVKSQLNRARRLVREALLK